MKITFYLPKSYSIKLSKFIQQSSNCYIYSSEARVKRLHRETSAEVDRLRGRIVETLQNWCATDTAARSHLTARLAAQRKDLDEANGALAAAKDTLLALPPKRHRPRHRNKNKFPHFVRGGAARGGGGRGGGGRGQGCRGRGVVGGGGPVWGSAALGQGGQYGGGSESCFHSVFQLVFSSSIFHFIQLFIKKSLEYNLLISYIQFSITERLQCCNLRLAPYLHSIFSVRSLINV